MNEYSPTTKSIINTYYNIESGWTNPNQIYKKLNKKIKLSKIKEIINKIDLQQIKWKTTDEKIYIPITWKPHTFQCDLTFFPYWIKNLNDGYYVIFNLININSKYLYSYLLKNKKWETILEYFKQFLKDCKLKINVLECDKGCEFTNPKFKKCCEDNNIKLILINKIESPNSIAICERLNRTIRDKITEYMKKYNTKKFYDVFEKIIKNYNNSFHRTIQDAPKNIDDKKENELYLNKIKERNIVEKEINNTFKIGDSVRILKKRKVWEVFKKGAKEHYSKLIYTIINKNINKFVVKSETGKIKEILPCDLKLVNEIIKNPYLKSEQIEQHKLEKNIIKENKKQNKIKKTLKKEKLK